MQLATVISQRIKPLSKVRLQNLFGRKKRYGRNKGRRRKSKGYPSIRFLRRSSSRHSKGSGTRMSPYADCPIVFASVFLSSFSFSSPPPRRNARSVRMYGAFACRGLFKSSPYCRGSLFFPLSLQEWVSAWVPRLDKKPADPRTEPTEASSAT